MGLFGFGKKNKGRISATDIDGLSPEEKQAIFAVKDKIQRDVVALGLQFIRDYTYFYWELKHSAVIDVSECKDFLGFLTQLVHKQGYEVSESLRRTDVLGRVQILEKKAELLCGRLETVGRNEMRYCYPQLHNMLEALYAAIGFINASWLNRIEPLETAA